MTLQAKRQPERTGVEGASVVFSSAAYLNVALAFVLLAGGWLGEIGAYRFLFLGLELAAAAAVTAAVALCIGPHRGKAARPAWLAASGAVVLVIVSAVWILPRHFGAGS